MYYLFLFFRLSNKSTKIGGGNSNEVKGYKERMPGIGIFSGRQVELPKHLDDGHAVNRIV